MFPFIERYSPGCLVLPSTRHQHLSRYLWASTLTRGKRVLDAACGTGYGAKIILDHGAREVVGFDLATDAIRVGQERYPSSDLRFAVADVTGLPVEDHRFDAYISMETIEHVENTAAFLTDVVRVLTPNGFFACSTPNRGLRSPRTSIAKRPLNPFHVREYTLPEFAAILERYFRSIEWFGQTFHATSYCKMMSGIAVASPTLSSLAHYAAKFLRVPWETIDNHFPVKLDSALGEPDMLVAVCRDPR